MGIAIRTPVVVIFSLFVLFTILFILFAPENLYAKVKEGVDERVDSALAGIKGEKIRQREEAIPQETKGLFDSLKETFEKTGKECIIEHPDFSDLKDYKIIMSKMGDDIYIRLKEEEQTEEEPHIKDSMIRKRNLCIVAGKSGNENVAENFFKYYFDNDLKYKGKLKYTNPTKITIVDEETIIVDGKEYDLEDRNLMFVDDENVCFFPTYDNGVTVYKPWQIITKYGCDASENGLDDDCIAALKDGKTINFCKGDENEK